MRKCTVLLLVACLVVSSFSVLAVPFVSAQAGYKPSVPYISGIKLVDSSYDVSPSTTTTVDQYTGKETTTTTQGYRVEQRSIEVTIKNQPFKPYTNSYSGEEIDLYYLVQVKGHFGEDWKSFGRTACTVQSNSGNTVVTSVSTYSVDSQLDFRVQAAIGFLPTFTDGMLGYWGAVGIFDIVAETRSDWSSVRVFTVPNDPSGSASPSQSATFPPVTSDGSGQPQISGQTQPPNGMFSNPLFMFGASVLFAGVVIVVVLVFLRRHIKMLTYTSDSTQPNTALNRCQNFDLLDPCCIRCTW